MAGREGRLDLRAMRISYDVGALRERDLAATWHEQLEHWLAEAVATGVAEPNAMVLATVSPEGVPSSRSVLCRGLDARGVVFYTNYGSAKSGDLAATGLASVTFPWYAMHRQVHVRGTVRKVAAAETAAYWATRPRGSQLGAWASPQSQEITSRQVLETALAGAGQRFSGTERIPVPPHWGGWRIRPQAVEFWQGRPDRLHDRLVFTRSGSRWRVRRLAP